MPDPRFLRDITGGQPTDVLSAPSRRVWSYSISGGIGHAGLSFTLDSGRNNLAMTTTDVVIG
jgi:hypothetical protein